MYELLRFRVPLHLQTSCSSKCLYDSHVHSAFGVCAFKQVQRECLRNTQKGIVNFDCDVAQSRMAVDGILRSTHRRRINRLSVHHAFVTPALREARSFSATPSVLFSVVLPAYTFEFCTSLVEEFSSQCQIPLFLFSGSCVRFRDVRIGHRHIRRSGLARRAGVPVLRHDGMEECTDGAERIGEEERSAGGAQGGQRRSQIARDKVVE